MSIFRKSDYINTSKKNNIVSPRRASHGGIACSPKIRLPTLHKSTSHKCSLCIRKDAKKYHISLDEVRWLCPLCVMKHKNKNTSEKPHFISARKLWRKPQ